MTIRMGGSSLSVTFRKSSQESRSQTSTWWFLKFRQVLFLLLGFLRILNDSMSVKRSSKVNFQDGRELVRIDEVNDGDSSTHEDTENSSDHDKPIAPAKVEHQDRLFESDQKRSSWKKFEVDEIAEKKCESCQRDKVGSVSWHHNQHQVGQHPKSKGHPKEDGGVITSFTVITSPAEPFSIHSKVFPDSQDGEGKTLEKSSSVFFSDLRCSDPVEPLVVVNVAGLVVDWQRLQGDVDGVQANVHADCSHDFLLGKCSVGRGYLNFCCVPSRSMLSN